MAKLSTPQSACASFCTAEDVEAIRSNRAYDVARRLRSAYNNSLVILPPRPRDARQTLAPLFLGTPQGIPHIVVKYSGSSYDNIAVNEADPTSLYASYGSPIVDSSNKSYVIARVKKQIGSLTPEKYTEPFVDVLKMRIFDFMKAWLMKASADNGVEVGTTITVDPIVQEYLIRYFVGNFADKELIPSSVMERINTAYNAIHRACGFTLSTRDHAQAMFARDKWFAIDMGSYVILTGVDLTSLCQVAQEIVSSKKNPNSAYYYIYANKFNLTITHEPTTYRSFDAMPEAVRASLMSSLAFTKATLLQVPEMSAKEESDGFFKIPYYEKYIASPDAGWVFKGGGYYLNSHGQTLLMDKD